ncbi:MAG: hypothetical protein JSV31_11430 [Desulfobacterales bacterium]|nr:MAG: hypothetical protein JSV31_11430 [Desulfobacterales bacterium]
MLADEKLLIQFESGLNPQHLEKSSIPASIIGYGEISAIFQIGDNSDIAFKRLPLFPDHFSAQKYIRHYNEYCQYLAEAGLNLPEDETFIIAVPNRPVVVYIAQKKLPAKRFGHNLIHSLALGEIRLLFEKIVAEIAKIWRFNHSALPDRELALDGQLSNWVWLETGTDMTMYYIDTSTPLFRKGGVEQLDPELFLKSAPGFLRWIIRRLFLENVMNRYYDQRQVFMDLAANLYKEQLPDLIPAAVDIINRHLSDDHIPLKLKEIETYYREDKLIWTLFLAFRRIDRWLITKLLHKRYEFILPGKIKR